MSATSDRGGFFWSPEWFEHGEEQDGGDQTDHAVLHLDKSFLSYSQLDFLGIFRARL